MNTGVSDFSPFSSDDSLRNVSALFFFFVTTNLYNYNCRQFNALNIIFKILNVILVFGLSISLGLKILFCL